MEMIRTDSYPVTSFSVDSRGRLSPAFLFRYLQESAYRNAEGLRLGYSHLGERKRLWVLSRFLLRVSRYPRWGEEIAVVTWPKGASRMFALRDFQVLDSGGTEIAAATSGWLVIDEETRRLQRLENLFEGMPLLLDRHAVREEPAKLPSPDDPVVVGSRRVGWSDLDVNGHVNSARYVEWVIDAADPRSWDTLEPRLLEVNYLAETRGGEDVSLSVGRGQEAFPSGEEAGRGVLHSLFRVSDGKEVCRVRIGWGRTAG